MHNRFLELVRRYKHMTYAFGEASNGLTLLFVAIMARFLDTGTFGVGVATIATAGILAEFSEFGFPVLLNRTVAQHPTQGWSLLKSSLGHQTLLAVPFFAAVYGYLLLARTPPNLVLPAFLIGASMYFRSLKNALRGACRARKMFGMEAASLWSERVMIIVFGVALFLSDAGLYGVAISFLVARAIDFIVFFWAVRRNLKKAGNDHGTLTRKTAFPFMIGTLMWSLYYQMNTTMVSLLATPHDTGLFGATYRFLDMFQVLPRVMVVVAFPALVVAWKHDKADFFAQFHTLQRRLALVASPLLLATFFGAEVALRFAFGEKFVEAADALRMVLIGIFLSCQSFAMANGLMAAGREKRVALSLAGCFLFSVAVNLMLIPRYGYKGAACTTAITELVYVITLYCQTRGLRAIKKSLDAGAVTTAVAALLLTIASRGGIA